MIKIVMSDGGSVMVKTKSLDPREALDEFNKKVLRVWGIKLDNKPKYSRRKPSRIKKRPPPVEALDNVKDKKTSGA